MGVGVEVEIGIDVGDGVEMGLVFLGIDFLNLIIKKIDDSKTTMNIIINNIFLMIFFEFCLGGTKSKFKTSSYFSFDISFFINPYYWVGVPSGGD